MFSQHSHESRLIRWGSRRIGKELSTYFSLLQVKGDNTHLLGYAACRFGKARSTRGLKLSGLEAFSWRWRRFKYSSLDGSNIFRRWVKSFRSNCVDFSGWTWKKKVNWLYTCSSSCRNVRTSLDPESTEGVCFWVKESGEAPCPPLPHPARASQLITASGSQPLA